MAKPPSDEYSDEEATRRMNEVVKRMINTPPTPHKPVGWPKPKTGAIPKKAVNSGPKQKERPASRGRVHKGKTGA